MCAECHELGEQAIALIRQMVARHPSLWDDARIQSDLSLANAEIHHIDRVAKDAP